MRYTGFTSFVLLLHSLIKMFWHSVIFVPRTAPFSFFSSANQCPKKDSLILSFDSSTTSFWSQQNARAESLVASPQKLSQKSTIVDCMVAAMNMIRITTTMISTTATIVRSLFAKCLTDRHSRNSLVLVTEKIDSRLVSIWHATSFSI